MAHTSSDLALPNVVNNFGGTSLAVTISSVDTTIVLADASGLSGTGGIITIENEIIKFETKAINTLSGCVRGIDGTAAAAHTAGVEVNSFLVAHSPNQLKAELQTSQSDIGNNETAIGNNATAIGNNALAISGLTTALDNALIADGTQVLRAAGTYPVTNKQLVRVDSTAGIVELTLPPVTTANMYIPFKDVAGQLSVNALRLTADSGEEIEGVAGSLDIASDRISGAVITDGTNYFII